MNKRAQLRQAMAQASTWEEQVQAVAALDAFEAAEKERIANDRALDLSTAVVSQTLAPRTAYDRDTVASDWLGSVEVTASRQEIAQRMVAEASTWYRNRPDYVKADQAEFSEQARGMAAKLAGQYAPLHHEAAKAFLDYAGYLRAVEAGSGLDQIQQTIDANNAPKTTELPTDVFDNFAPPVHDLNSQVDGTETSERNPMFQTINEGGQGGAEKPDEHDEAADFSHSYAEVPPDTMGSQASVALGYRYNMDDFRRQGPPNFKEAATGLDEVDQAVGPNNEPNDTNPAPGQSETYPTDVAFPLVSAPEEQTTSPNGVVPKGSAAAKRQAFVASLMAKKPEDLTEVERKEISAFLHSASVRKTADEWSAPHQVPGGETPVGNSAETTPQPANSGTYDKGRQDGQRDRQAGERPTFSDASSSVSDYVRGYSEGYGSAGGPQGNPDVPYSMGGDAGQAQNAQDSQNAAQVAMASRKVADGVSQEKRDKAESKGHTLPGTDKFPIDNAEDLENAKHDIGRTNEPKDKVRRYINERAKELGEPGLGESDDDKKAASLVVSASFVDPDEADNPDFRKGYRFAARWAPGKKLVATGSPAFEAGLYAAISDRPDVQRAWVAAHREQQGKHAELAHRLSSHAALTQAFAEHTDVTVKGLYVQAATSTDLDTTGPGSSPDPLGSTPINGPGTVPPLAGQGDPAASGGPAPYQGAEPFGNGPVAPDPVVGPTQGQPGNGQFVPMPSPGQPAEVPSGLTDVESVLKTNPKAAAFRHLVTANRAQG